MANCPNCGVHLQTVRSRDGIYSHCNQCDGRAVSFPQIRRTTGDRFVSGLIRQARHATQVSIRPCPFCEAPMKNFLLSRPPISLDSCLSCTMVWFDGGKFEQLPEGVAETPEEAMFRAMEAEATWKIEQEKNRNQAGYDDPPDEAWKWVPAMLGLPVKFESSDISQRPWVTWSLSLLVTLTSVIAFFHLKDAVETFGMIPDDIWRYGGITLLTSFFIHGGFWHLASNLYFFLLFGGDVECFLGRWRFLGLIFLSTIIGNALHALFNMHSLEPVIGASGGISGVLVFYALQFPRAKLSFLFRFYFRFVWVHIPAWVAFIAWLLLQFIGAYMQVAGFSNVASFAHLGGVLTGFVLWLWWRKLGAKNAIQDAGY
ncbi:MAG TPA: rhomboid family intramembrane serine protease [Pseudomonadales bacterium]|nr:rhomboid family intramembrane serine protease [Pseudomonadales bacterium]